MLHKFHRFSAVVIGTFVVFHLANHLVAATGVKNHMAVMDVLRIVYRRPITETILLACVVFQVFSGIKFVVARWDQRSGVFEKLQADSGAYLVFFLLIHVSAVLSGRALYQLDTNFYFAAAGLHVPVVNLFFYPYYALAVAAIFTHIGCALHWGLRDKRAISARDSLATKFAIFGLVLGLIIVLIFGGVFFDIEIPAKYLATYQ